MGLLLWLQHRHKRPMCLAACMTMSCWSYCLDSTAWIASARAKEHQLLLLPRLCSFCADACFDKCWRLGSSYTCHHGIHQGMAGAPLFHGCRSCASTTMVSNSSSTSCTHGMLWLPAGAATYRKGDALKSLAMQPVGPSMSLNS